MIVPMRQRQGSKTQWSVANPVLGLAEIGYETDTNRFKIGNGSSPWTDLDYFLSAQEVNALINQAIINGGGTIGGGGGSGTINYTLIDGGSPTNTAAYAPNEVPMDGGTPTSSGSDGIIIDGGTADSAVTAGSDPSVLLDGGTPTDTATGLTDGGSPSSTSANAPDGTPIDGGTP